MNNIFTTVAFLVAGGMIAGVFLITDSDDSERDHLGEADTEEEFGIFEEVLSAEDLLETFDIRGWNRVEHNTAGSPEAPVVLVQYSDYACHLCFKFWEEVLPKIKSSFIDKGLVMYVYNDFAVHGGERAMEAVWCASEQGAFWPYHDVIYSRYEKDRQRWSLTELHKGYSEALGLNVNSFLRCFEDRKYKRHVEEIKREALIFGVPVAPFFIINDKIIPGFQDFEFFEEIILEEIKNSLAEEENITSAD